MESEKLLSILNKINETDNICLDIKKLISDLAIGNIKKCKFCTKQLIVLESDNGSHETYQYNSFCDEYVCTDCSFSCIKCSFCSKWKIYDIYFVPVKQCHGFLIKNDNLNDVCQICNSRVRINYDHLCGDCLKYVQNK